MWRCMAATGRMNFGARLNSMSRGLGLTLVLALQFGCSDGGRWIPEQGADWLSVRREILDFYTAGSAQSENISIYTGIVETETTAFTVELPGADRVVLGREGYRRLRELTYPKYSVEIPDGPTIYFLPQEFVEQFQRVQGYHNDGARIQMVPFPGGLGVPTRTLQRLHLGSSIGESILEEDQGVLHMRPEGMNEWSDDYLDKRGSRLFAVDSTTGGKGQRIGWIIDLIILKIEGRGYFVLKKVIADGGQPLPDYLITRPSGRVLGDASRIRYQGRVIGDDGEPKAEGPFRAFGPPMLIIGINAQ